jgi:S1-C subfamily serine protease
MKRPTLYSRSPSRVAPPSPSAHGPAADVPAAATVSTAPAAAVAGVRRRWPPATAERLLLILGGVALAALVFAGGRASAPAPRAITQKDIDKAVLHTLATKDLPSQQARAAEKIAKSVVLVRGVEGSKDGAPDIEESIGTGVVIVDTGIILTNMHVALAAKQLKVEFADGLVSDAVITGLQPEHDLAVLRSRLIPDDLQAATLRSTSDLRPGDHVVAVGFPFGIGPSASAGVISGLKREFRSPRGERVLTNLIQFDAAANPGNSGGPLVTLDGEVVGIVTAILNPTEQRVFIGIGFAVPIENAASGVGIHPF